MNIQLLSPFTYLGWSRWRGSAVYVYESKYIYEKKAGYYFCTYRYDPMMKIKFFFVYIWISQW